MLKTIVKIRRIMIRLIKMIICLLSQAEKTHKGKPKPLMWREVKHDERFRSDDDDSDNEDDNNFDGNFT